MQAATGAERVRDNLKRAISRYIRDTPIDVLVLGPSLESDDDRASVVLRREILDRCGRYGAKVRGEDVHLLKEAKRLIGSKVHNLCSFELTLAADVCDAVVIVPDSPGSFAELGLFAMVSEKICSKILVLFSEEYKNDESYLMGGPKRAYEMNGATVAFVDYSEPDRAWRKVRGFLNTARQKKRDRSHFA